MEPTPDGRALFCESQNVHHPNDADLHMLSVDGKADRVLPSLWMMDRVWMGDGKHWLISREDGNFLNGINSGPTA